VTSEKWLVGETTSYYSPITNHAARSAATRN
jgi:hypothetical protein